MKIQLIADSCCDVTPQLRAALRLRSVPLNITVDKTRHFTDDETLDVKELLAAMKASKHPVATAAPSPEDYASAMRGADAAIVLTLSSKLSGSYNAAMAGKTLVQEETPDMPVAVLDSKSASAGQLRQALKARELIDDGLGFNDVVAKMHDFIDNMRTLFILEDLSSLVKNGRIPKLAGAIGSAMMMRPIMGENGNGEIIPVEKIRGSAKAFARLVEIISDATAGKKNRSILLCLSYCNQPQRALELKKQILTACPAIEDVILAPTGGLSTCYANDGGVVVAYG